MSWPSHDERIPCNHQMSSVDILSHIGMLITAPGSAVVAAEVPVREARISAAAPAGSRAASR